MRASAGRFTILFLAIGLVLWAYHRRLDAPPERPRLPDHPLVRAKLETEQLMNSSLALAKDLLLQDGEFKPFASAITAHKELQHVAGVSKGERSSGEIVELLERSLREEADERAYEAIAIVSDVRFEVDGETEPRAAVQVTLEHRGGYCVDVIAPYRRTDENLEYDALMAASRSGRVFAECRPLPSGDASPKADLRES